MKKLTDYLERAAQLEEMAAKEPDSRFKEQLLVQADAYRKLASKWADDLGMPPLSSRP
jgi:hypothetical protein